MSDNCNQEITNYFNDGLNDHINENPQYVTYMDFHFQHDTQPFPLAKTIDNKLKSLYGINDISICQICILFESPFDVDSYIIYTVSGGVRHIDQKKIESFKIGEVKAISCPHNQLNLKNFSKDFGHWTLKYLKTFKRYKEILELMDFTLGTQGHFKIQYFDLLCRENQELRDAILYFLRFKSYPQLKASNIDTQGQRPSAFLVNLMHYIKVLSNPNKELRKNIEN